MPPKKMPDHGSRWWAKGDGPPRVADVIHDKRFKHKVRVHLLNDTRQYGHRDAMTTATPVEEWDDHWQAQPRTPLEWINTGSVWRHIPDVGWWERDRNLRVTLGGLVVVDRIQNGGMSLVSVDHDGTLSRYHGCSLGMGRITCHDFMWKFARIWVADGGGSPEDPSEYIFPGVLYHRGFLKRHKVHIPTALEVTRAIETISESEQNITRARKVIADHEKGMTPKKHRRRRVKKPPPKRLSAWERIMEDDG